METKGNTNSNGYNRGAGGEYNKNNRSSKSKNAVGDGTISLSQMKVHYNKDLGIYRVYCPAMNMLIGEVNLIKDNQYILDVACLNSVSEVLSQRYNITKNKIKPSSMHTAFKNKNVYAEIVYIQVDVNRYEFYLPNGVPVAWISTPPDMQYSQDLTVIKEVCVALAQRYNLI